jgi:hypothetical protein
MVGSSVPNVSRALANLGLGQVFIFARGGFSFDKRRERELAS